MSSPLRSAAAVAARVMVGGATIVLCAAAAARADRPPADLPVGHEAFRASPDRPLGWRGDGTGRYPGAEPVTAWDVEKGINVLWRVRLREFSCSTPVVAGDRVLTTVEPRTLLCLDKMTGKLLWMTDGSSERPIRDVERLREVLAGPASQPTTAKADLPWSRRKLGYGQYSGSSMPTPVTDGRSVWVKNGAVAACFDLEGNRRWIVQTHLQPTDHPMNVPSPVLIDGVLACEGGATPYWEANGRNKVPKGAMPLKIPGKTSSYKFKHWMVGLNARTGELLWDIGPLHAGGYGGAASPTAVRTHGDGDRKALVLTAEGHLIRAADGKLMVPYVGLRSAYASPYPVDGGVLFPGCYDHGMLDLEMDPGGRVRTRVVWSQPCAKAMSGSVYHDGLIYLHSVGRNERTPMLNIYDARTGEGLYREKLPITITPAAHDYPTPAFAGKYVFVFTGMTAAVIEPGRRPWVLAVSEFERMHASATFDGDRLYLRTYDAMMCLARTGDEGARYERQVQARTLVGQFPKRLRRPPFQEVAPPPDFTPGRGVAVARQWKSSTVYRQERDTVSDQWLFAGPFPAAKEEDALRGIGGCRDARPAAGTTVAFGKTTHTFQPLSRKFVTSRGLDVSGPAEGQRGVQSFYYTVIEVSEPAMVVCEIDKPQVWAWLGGRPIEAGQVLALKAGQYPLLVKAFLGQDGDPSADSNVKVAFSESPPPDERFRRDLAFVREHRAVLRRVMELAPGSGEAAQAAELLQHARAAPAAH